MPDPSDTRRRLLDGLAGAAGVLGGAMLLSRRSRPAATPAAFEPGDAEFDDTARYGRGRPVAGPSRAMVRVGHEQHDANAGKVGLVMAGLAGSVIAALVILYLLMSLFHGQLRASRPVLTDMQRATLDPPPPLLEAHPSVDLHTERARELAARDGYAWRDPRHTSAHVPIDRAMALAVGRSLDAAP